MVNIFNKFTGFLKEVRVEMKKVNWPSRRTTFKYTLIVVGVSLAVAAYLGSLDVLFTTILNKLITK
jgi:preprotein translocase subunit SecE